MPADSVVLLTIQGRTIDDSLYFDSFVFIRCEYKGEHNYAVEIQQPILEMNDFEAYSPWIHLPKPDPIENIHGFENPFWVVEDLWEREFGLEDCEVVELSFSGPSDADVREFYDVYLSKSAYSKTPYITPEAIRVDGRPLNSSVKAETEIENWPREVDLMQLMADIEDLEHGNAFEQRINSALVARIVCKLPGVSVGSGIAPIVDEEYEEHVIVPGAYATEYSLTICGSWLVCEPREVEQEHWIDPDEDTSGAYWTTVSHYEPKLELVNTLELSSEAFSKIREIILTSADISDTCRAAMLILISK
jgi:hypothetical protein